MSLPTKLSVVLPVRDCQHQIIDEVERVLDALAEMLDEAAELIVVDDGSSDATPDVLAELQRRHQQVRVTRHHRPRGMEAAGQTGLEKAKGDLVFIQETDSPIRLNDFRRLYEMSRDPSVVAARAQSTAKPFQGPLMRRLRAWGNGGEQQVRLEAQPGLQMIRRPHLQRLATPAGKSLQLQSERITVEQQS